MTSEIREHNGHRIELRSPPPHGSADHDHEHDHDETGDQLLVDGRPVPYGTLPDGLFFLHDYAYDWTDDLLDLAERYVDYLDKTKR